MRPNDAGTGSDVWQETVTSGSPDVHGWQPINTAPMDGSAVLLWPWNGMVAGDARMGSWNGYSWDDGDFHDDMGDMTHWMPLPSPPSGAAS